jgi:hypothetical protein
MAPVKNIADSFSSLFSSDITDSQSFVGVTTTATTDATLTTPGNGYNYYFYTSPGTFTVNKSGYVDVCVVAGGGGGGSGGLPVNYGGGGGAGGILQKYFVLFTPGTYAIVVGGGGAGAPVTGATASQGTGSSIIGPGISLTTTGGGKGGGGPGGSGGGSGGSGGGGGIPLGIRGSSTGSNLDMQGTDGGNASGGSPAQTGGGGGASIRGAWGGAPTSALGVGGNGISAFNNDTGVPPAYGATNPTIAGRWFAGGGGGVVSAAGGVGGGGNGGTATGSGSNAVTNTGGGGGGGGGTNANDLGGNGGSGIVILRTKVMRM